jgi:redox-sensing transcriptional repressor
MVAADIPDIVISRLPIYLRALTRLQDENDNPDARITSGKLAERLGISSAQIRKDLSHFGEFGTQGRGYLIRELATQLRRILNVDREWEVALVGAGAIGTALAHYNGFRDRGFRIAAIFDNDPAKIGTLLNGFEILAESRLGEIIPARGITLAMLAVPADAAQHVADELVTAGVRGILSYAPINIVVPPDVHVQQIDPVVHMQRITYYL